MRRRVPRDCRFTKDKRIWRIWMSKGKRHIRRLERYEAGRDIDLQIIDYMGDERSASKEEKE